MNINNVLRQLGLKDKEVAVYLSCLELGQATASQISKRAGIKRPYFYDLMPGLIAQGLIKITKREKQTLYSSADPEYLKIIEQEKLKQLEEILPELKSAYKVTGSKPKIYFYYGKEGIKEINNDTLRYKGEMLGFSTQKFITADEKKLALEYIQKRMKNRIKARVIGPVSSEFLEIKKRDHQELRETKMLPQDLYQSNVEFTFYGNKMAIVNYRENFGFIIESSDVVNPLKQIFELIWRGGFVIE